MDKKHEKLMHKFGLIGKQISYSFSKIYFTNKFKEKEIGNACYVNFDIDTINLLPNLLKDNKNIKGLNVTIPYKETIIPYLDKLSKKAKKIGAVNTIKISKKGKLIGYNTDCYGFKKSISTYLNKSHKNALILGSGGASKAIIYSLRKMNIQYSIVSRTASKHSTYTYQDLDETIISSYQLIINCTPLGTSPHIELYPNIPYKFISDQHILFDLIYNPEETIFLKKGRERNATTINGLKMLQFQADKAWAIWNS